MMDMREPTHPYWGAYTDYINVQSGNVAQVPTGMPAPADCLPCNGAEYSRDLYPVLFGIIGEKYGAGDGTTTFKVPDLRIYPQGERGPRMKTITRTHYVCEICGKTSVDESKVLECAGAHQLLEEAEVTPEYSKSGIYPRRLKVTFDDGTTHVFVR